MESFIGIVNHNAIEGCQRCTISGQRINNRTCFPRSDCPKRTDIEFRNRSIPAHHQQTSIIERLPNDMIGDFVIAEDLHLFYLGIIKKCMTFWKDGDSNLEYKWSESEITNLNQMLKRINNDMPFEIHRSIRSIDCYKFWKGSELRTFLLYLGIVVLRHFLRQKEYKHFLKLFCAVTLCTTDKYIEKSKQRMTNLIHELFTEYIEEFIDIYGIEYVSSNVHNLCHVSEDILKFGNLTKMSAFRFENCLGGLKNRIRNCNRPLEQISRRICELNLDYRTPINLEENNVEPLLQYPFENSAGQLVHKRIILGKDLVLNSRNFGDKWVLLDSGEVVEFYYCFKRDEDYWFCGSCLENLGNFFTEPFSSKNIYIFSGKYKSSNPNFYRMEKLMAKMICIRDSDEFVFIPLAHTLK